MNSDIEKIRNSWHEWGQKVFECQKHGIFHCKILVPPTEKYCERCQAEIKDRLKIEAWKKAREKAQNWWKSLSLPQKQEQIKLLEESLKNEKPWEIDIITWGNIKSGQSETYKNGKFFTTDIEQVPTKLVKKFIDHSNIPPSCQTPNLNSFCLNNPSQPNNNQFSNLNQSNQTTPNPQNLNTSRTISSTGNLSSGNFRPFSETLNNQNQSYNQKKVENENIPPTEKSESQNPLPTSTALKNIVNTSQAKKDQGLTRPLLISLFLLSLFGIIIFSLWKKNKRLKS